MTGAQLTGGRAAGLGGRRAGLRRGGRAALAARWARTSRVGATLGVATALALPLAVAAPAQAAGQPGYCPDATGVTVVVDFQALGGGVVVRCAPAPLGGSGTGLDALVAAGFPLEGVRRWGDSFICRLDGKPAVDTALPVTGKPGYHEQCVDTPPSTAFWGYWYAPNGGAWQYADAGVKGHRAIVGGFEGWSFSLDAGGSGNPVPRLTPTRPTAPASSPAAPAAGPGSGAGAGSGAAAGRPAATAPSAGGGSRAGGTASATPGAAPGTTTGGASTPGATTSATPGAATTTAGAVPPPSRTDPPVVSGQLTSAGAVAPSGPSAGTVAGVGVLAFLLVAGAGTAWRRRRGTGAE